MKTISLVTKDYIREMSFLGLFPLYYSLLHEWLLKIYYLLSNSDILILTTHLEDEHPRLRNVMSCAGTIVLRVHGAETHA